jgi:hypothetical protein
MVTLEPHFIIEKIVTKNKIIFLIIFVCTSFSKSCFFYLFRI